MIVLIRRETLQFIDRLNANTHANVCEISSVGSTRLDVVTGLRADLATLLHLLFYRKIRKP